MVRAIVLVALASLLGATAGWWWWSGRAERHLAHAEEALRRDETDAALAWLSVPEVDPGTRDRALLLRARVFVERGDLTRAVAALDQVRHDGPQAPEFAYWKGRTLYVAGQPLLAMNWLLGAHKARPGDAEAARWLAAAAYDLGDRATAVEALEAVSRLEPADPKVWRTLGLIAKENVDFDRAAVELGRSLRHDPGQPAVRLDLAEVHLKLGDLASALKQLGACRGFVPKARHAAILAECLRLQGDLEGLGRVVKEGLIEAPNDPDLLTQQARLDLAEGRTALALDRLDRAVGADPYRAESLYQRGLVLRQLGRQEESRGDLDRSNTLKRWLGEMSALNDRAAREPSDASVRFDLGGACEQLGKFELAASWYRAALACDPNHEAAKSAMLALSSRPRR